MQVTVNGERQTLPAEVATIAQLLKASGVESVEMVSVQRNGEFVEKDALATAQLAEGDEIDFLYFMGGGGR